MKYKSIVALSTRVGWLLTLALLTTSSVMLIGITTSAQDDDFTRGMAAVIQVREEIKRMPLQEAKDTIIRRLGSLPKVPSAELGSIEGYDLGFRTVRAFGGVVSIKDRFTGRSVLIKGDAQADKVMKSVTQLEFDPVMTVTQAVQIIKAENFAKSGVVYVDLRDEILNGKRYNLQFCLDEKHGGLTIIRDTWTQRKVALNASADADKVMKIVTELKFDPVMTLVQAQEIIKGENFAKLGVIYADLGDEILDGKRNNLRFPVGETPKTACTF